MLSKTCFWIAATATIALAAAAPWPAAATERSSSRRSATESEHVAPVATPAGITLQRVGERGSTGQGTAAYVYPDNRRRAFGTASGMTLYTYDKDVEPGKSACTADCAHTFPPATAPSNATASGDWSLITRDDGTNQWRYKGKALYRFSKEERPGETKGNGAMEGLWHEAVYEPAARMNLPYGMIGVQEVAEANGQMLVDGRKLTLYLLDGDQDQDKQPPCSGSCSDHFTPLSAPALVKPVGDFSIVRRHDGTKQWAYRGKLLYTYDGDLTRGDAYGIDRDKRWQVALVERYFMPAEASIRTTLKGKLLATADGMTLYRLDGYVFDAGGGYSLHRAIPLRPSVGRDIGWQTCVEDCLKQWHPLKASAKAEPSGYWEIATRNDGTRQWVYQGYPMYTYGGDKKPGDMAGNDKYQHLISEDPDKVAYSPTPMTGAGALYWSYTAP